MLRDDTTHHHADTGITFGPFNLTPMTTYHRIPDPSPQALVLAQIADEDKPMPSDEDVKRIAREHHLPDTEAEALVRFARAVSKIAEE
jgi:hypothetical protein